MPPFKKSTLDPSDPANYLPVLYLSFLSKVIEIAAAKQFQAFLDDVSMLNPFQSGFHTRNETKMALITLTDDVCKQLNQGKLALLSLLDLIAIFDTVDYDILTHHLADM